MKKFAQEISLIVSALLPLIYVIAVYNELPETIPTHFGMHGPDDWGNKQQLFLLPGSFGIVLYLLMLLVPRLDPKNRIEQMGSKWFSMRLLLQLFFTAIGMYIVAETKNNGADNGNFMFVIMGAFFALLGNYFQTIRPNYFIGIRTPWTLENETVWRTTHQFAGKIWIGGGLLLIATYFLNNPAYQVAVFLGIVALMVIVPVVYSYQQFRKQKLGK